MKIYGIPNCTTVKRARAWLSESGVENEFHDFKKQGVPEVSLLVWMQAVGWERLINRQGTTWRKLDASRQLAVTDPESAASLMREMPSVIRRPVVEWADGEITVGFDPSEWAKRI